MDSITEKSCLEEVSTLVLDADEKVTVKKISNNWLVTNKVAQEVLLKWLDQNKKKSGDLAKEFIVQGKNRKGEFRISVVSEEMKNELEKKWKTFSSMLYSVETKRTPGARDLNIPDYEPIKIINILLNPREPRDLQIPEIPAVKVEPVVTKKPEPTKAKSLFNIVKPEVKPELKKIEQKPLEKPKEEVKSPEKKPSPVSNVAETKKQVKKSPEESKSVKPSANSKKIQLKHQKPVQKGGISSFFSSKPSTSKAPTTVNPPVKQKEKSPVEKQKEKSPVENISSDDEPLVVASKMKLDLTPKKAPVSKQVNKKKPAASKIKLKEKGTNKRSRIRVMEDSSEEEEVKSDSDEPENKLIKFDREFTPERPTVAAASPEKKPEGEKLKRKAKRWVTKRFQSEDGFFKTERHQEEYSASEDENDENKKKNSPTKPKVVEKKNPSPVKAKPTQSSKTKNGSITSFFNKK